jgi:prolyl oligopeptidase
MKVRISNILCLVLSTLVTIPCHAQWNYPPTKTVNAADTYFGHTYKDPYRWLENLQDPEVAAWFKAQADLADQLLAKIPARDELIKEWTALDKLTPAIYTGIQYENGRVFYKKTLGGDNIGKLYWRYGWKGEVLIRLFHVPVVHLIGTVVNFQLAGPNAGGDEHKDCQNENAADGR